MSREQALLMESIVAGVVQVSTREKSHYKRTFNYNFVHCGSHDVSDYWKGFEDFFNEIARFLDDYADEVINNISGVRLEVLFLHARLCQFRTSDRTHYSLQTFRWKR